MNLTLKIIIGLVVVITVAVVLILIKIMNDRKTVKIQVTGDLTNGTEQVKIRRLFKNGDPEIYILGSTENFAVITPDEPVIDLSIDYVEDSILVFETSHTQGTLDENGKTIDENIRVSVKRGFEDLTKNILLIVVKADGYDDFQTYDQVIGGTDYYSDDIVRHNMEIKGGLFWHGMYSLVL
jgi:hypothetical protein